MNQFDNFTLGFTTSFITSNVFSYSKDLSHENVINKILQGINLYILFSRTYAPFYLLFNQNILDISYYSIATIIGLNLYSLSILDDNQLKIDNDDTNIKTIVFDLHDNPYFIKLNKLFCDYVNYLMLASYFTACLILAISDPSLYLITSVVTIIIDQIYKNKILPQSLNSIYRYFTFLIIPISFYGTSSIFSIFLSSLFLIFKLFDNLFPDLNDYLSSSAQFPLSNKLHKIDNLNNNQEIQNMCDIFDNYDQKIDFYFTFEHLCKCKEIYNSLINRFNNNGFEEYRNLFDDIDFNDPNIKNFVVDNFNNHEAFNSISLKRHKINLNLAENTDPYEVKVTYLKKQIKSFLERLNQQNHEDLSENQIKDMYGHANIILKLINDDNICNLNRKKEILLKLAMATGSNSNSIYLESLGNISSQLSTEKLNKKLSLEERTILTIQLIRENAVKEYYYKIYDEIPMMENFFDKNNNQLYTLFANTFCSNFFLINSNLDDNFRNIFTMFFDYYINFLFKSDKLRFIDFYTVDYLINQALKPYSKLFYCFEEWCKIKEINILDENNELDHSINLRNLVKIMLLELNVISHNNNDLGQRIKPR